MSEMVSFGFGDDIGAGGEGDAWGFWRLWMYVCMYVVRRLGGEKLVSTVGSLGCHNHLKNGKLFTSKPRYSVRTRRVSTGITKYIHSLTDHSPVTSVPSASIQCRICI